MNKIEKWAEARPAKVKAEEAVEDAALALKAQQADFSRWGGQISHVEWAEAALAEANRRCECAEQVEKEQQAVRAAKTASYVQQYEAHLAIVRERHPHLLRAYARGKEALVRLCKANALVYSENKHELLTQLVNADAHGCASQCDARGRPGRCPRCAAKLHLVCSPCDLQPNQPIRLECRNRLFKKGGQTMGGARSCIGSSFERCGWRADITAENKSELLSVRIKDSWQGDLLPAHPSSEPVSAGTCALVPESAAELPVALQRSPPSPTPPPSPQEPKRLSRSASSSSNEERLAICDDAPGQASSDDMSEDQPVEEDLELEDEKAQEQEYLARERRAEAVREAAAGSFLGRELAPAAYDRVMNGEDEEDEEMEEDEDEETQQANALHVQEIKARIIAACDSILQRGDED